MHRHDGTNGTAGELGGVAPGFCSLPAAMAVVLGGQLLALVLVLAAGWPPNRIWERIALVSFYVQWIGLSSAVLLCLLQPWLRRLGEGGAGVAAWLLLLAVTVLVAESAYALGASVPGLFYFDAGDRWGLLLRSLGVSGIAGALILRYLYLHRQWRRQLEARSQARFQALQARIRPHFLFNSMNTIASLTRSDPARAETVVEDLADLFRAALSDHAEDSTLGRELELVRRYLEVEQLRLAPRLRVEWDLEELPEEAPLPLLVFQPLVENAVYHGVEPAAEPGVVRIAGRYRGNRVNLSVRNSLTAADPGRQHRQGNRIALDNVRQRLVSMFPGRSALTVGRVEGEFQVRLVFPYP